MIDAIDFCVSSSNALQQCPSLRGGGGELPAADGRRGPVEPQRYSNTTDWTSCFPVIPHVKFASVYLINRTLYDFKPIRVNTFVVSNTHPRARSDLSGQTTLQTLQHL